MSLKLLSTVEGRWGIRTSRTAAKAKRIVDFPFPSSLPFQPERHDRADHLALAHSRKARGGALKVYGYE